MAPAVARDWKGKVLEEEGKGTEEEGKRGEGKRKGTGGKSKGREDGGRGREEEGIRNPLTRETPCCCRLALFRRLFQVDATLNFSDRQNAVYKFYW